MTTIVEHIGMLSVGRVETVTAEELRISLFPETPQVTALNAGSPTGFPRINAYVLIPNESGAVVAVIKQISIQRSKPVSDKHDESLVDLPFPARNVIAIPFGTLSSEGYDDKGQHLYSLERGVTVLPSVGDPVLLPTAEQLRSIVEAKTEDRLIRIGSAPFANNADVWVHPDKLFGRHLAILGNTGSGKSCSVAGIIRWSLEGVAAELPKKAEKEEQDQPINARFIILDPNGEYSHAFTDGTLSVRRFAVGGKDGAKPLTVPGWLWNGQEWAAFTDAKPGTQRPILLDTLRQLRKADSSANNLKNGIIRRYRGHIKEIEKIYADFPQSLGEFRDNMNFGERLKGLIDSMSKDIEKLSAYGDDTTDLREAIESIYPNLCQIHDKKHYSKPQGKYGYNYFQALDLENILAELQKVVNEFPTTSTKEKMSEDAPIRFDIADLPDRIHDVAMAMGGQALSNVEPLINRIRVMLSDSRLRPIIDTDGAESFDKWLSELMGGSEDNNAPLTILDLSLVPSDVIHITIAVIARIVFQALQYHIKKYDGPLPTVLVLDEAHNFVRKDADVGANEQAANLCRQIFERIAREGRKFGLGLVLASQRPSELSPTVLAQCNSFLLHRIVNDVDQNLVRRLVPDALGGLLGELPTLPSQQAILLGWAVPNPVLVRIRDLQKNQRPRSDDPKFWDVWVGKAVARPDWQVIAKSWEQESGKNS
ncbi:ATP-binding protein [Thermopetrobacter sp. TC1]|uniref:ATP-binding protein n=1 Tax=Thermopetrobacter sp. TC1 TaxID=1495045 RepID=UPI0009DFD660|nr:ATP-binding protein [Thermopetrobacter sp. TC1]